MTREAYIHRPIDANAFYACLDVDHGEKVEDILCGLLCAGVNEETIEVHEFPYAGITRVLVNDVIKYEIRW